MADSIASQRLEDWIGREETACEDLSLSLARRFLATFDADDPGLKIGDPAPRLIHFCLNQPRCETNQLGADGHPPKGGFLPPTPLPRRMWASGELTFHADLRIGDAVTRRSRIVGVENKTGRNGDLCFVTVQHRIEARGDCALEEVQRIVYRGPGGPAAQTLARAEPGERQRRVEPTPALLFRYSALTFNAHRIHYDRVYAREQEGYPGLVVHGPLLATLLLRFATEIGGGQPPARFAFRSHAPIFEGEPFWLHARREPERLLLWAATQEGPSSTSAEAAWS